MGQQMRRKIMMKIRGSCIEGIFVIFYFCLQIQNILISFMDTRSQIITQRTSVKNTIMPQASYFHYYDDHSDDLDRSRPAVGSKEELWDKVYQFPHYQPEQAFFKGFQQSKTNDSEGSAQVSWERFNPNHQPVFQFDIYKMLKDTKDHQENQLSKDELATDSKDNHRMAMIEPERPPAFMGAFSHAQPSFNFFNMNISMPTSKEYKPFSCFYHDQNNQQEENLAESRELQANNLGVSSISAIKDIKKSDDRNKYFFELDEPQHEIQQSKDFSIKQSKINHAELESEVDKSILWNYEALFAERLNFKHRDPTWDDQHKEKEIAQSRVFEVNLQDNLKTLHHMELQLNLTEEMKEVLSDQFVLSETSKILQSIQCQLFTLDYMKMEWSLQLSKYRLQHSLRNSLKYRLKDILTIANYRSRIDIALQYIRKRPFRRVYYQLGVQITQILILFQGIILQQSKSCNLIQFLLYLDKLKLEITLIYKLLINQSYIIDEQRSYEDFDYRYLNSQYVIFKQIVKQSKFSDSLNTQIKPLINTLLNAAFKPIINILNNLLFQQCSYIQLNDQIYLKYFFDNHKDIVNFISKKIGLIKGENNQLYQICRIKESMEILHNLKDLEEYEHRWERNFNKKKKLIERIRKNHKLKIKHEKERKHQERMKFIYSLKSRIYQQNQQENARKKMISMKNKEELERLKKEIDAKQERRKLLETIEKEKEKGLLLDISLQDKQRLFKEKELLMRQLQQLGQDYVQSKESLKMEEANGQEIPSSDNLPANENLGSNPSLKQRISAQQDPKQLEAVSHQQIKSNPNIQSNKMAFTADNFFNKREKHTSRLSQDNRTESYFRLTTRQAKETLEPDSSSDLSMEVQQQSLDSQDFHPISQQLDFSRQIDLSTSLQICLSQIIKKQHEVIQSSLRFIILDKYQILTIIHFMKNIFMSGNGQKVQEFINTAINQDSMLNLKYFSECLLFDTHLQIIEKLQPSFYFSKNQNKFNTEIHIFQENIQHFIGFQFSKLPVILQPYFSYIHLSKYMQIFNFIVRVKYSQNLISRSWKMLNNYKKDLQRRERQGENMSAQLSLLKRLYSVRYFINNYLITFQGYMFLKIIEQQFKIFKMSIDNLHDLEHNHLKMLQNIIRFSFIDIPNNNTATKNFKHTLNLINQFYQIVYQLSLDDVPGYRWNQTQKKVELIHLHFKKQQQYIDTLILKLT